MGFIEKEMNNDYGEKTKRKINEVVNLFRDEHKNKMTWDEFLKKLSDRIDEIIIEKNSELNQEMVGGKATLSYVEESVSVACALYYADENDSFKKIELKFNIPIYKFQLNDESTVTELKMLKNTPVHFNVSNPA